MALEFARHIIQAYRTESEAGLIAERIRHWNFPDLHFSYPFVRLDERTHSEKYAQQWKEFLSETPWGNSEDWASRIRSSSGKNVGIFKAEAERIIEKTKYTAFEGGAKVLILWQPERMNADTSNRLLKLLEEPPRLTFFILVSEQPEGILPTILSRCVAYRLSPLETAEIEAALCGSGMAAEEARLIAPQASGNLRKAMVLAQDNENAAYYQDRFAYWVRCAFRAKKDRSAIRELLDWSEEMAKLDRNQQRDFLNYCSEIFRWALHRNYASALPGEPIELSEDFDLRKFAPFVHEGNIEDIQRELESAIYHIQRYVNSKTVFSDISVKITRYLHRPAAS